jgi:hypothetical protein
LFVIDGITPNPDDKNFEKLPRVLRDEDFQVLVTLPSAHESSITELVAGIQKLRAVDYPLDWRLQKI